MDMDQVWSIFFINLFSALVGVEIAFFVSFLFPFFGLGEKVLNAGVGLVVFFSHIQMNVVVDMHGWKERKGDERKGREGRNLQV